MSMRIPRALAKHGATIPVAHSNVLRDLAALFRPHAAAAA